MQKYIEFGNLTGRYNDGVFQKNLETNAFYKKVMSIIELKLVPEDLKNLIIDFTPVDLIGNAIYKLIFKSTDNNIVYHLYNSNTITIEQLVTMLNEIGFNIKMINQEEINNLSRIEQKRINELMFEIYPTINKSNITIENTITDEILKTIDFDWKIIDKQYLLRTINYVREVMSLNENN